MVPRDMPRCLNLCGLCLISVTTFTCLHLALFRRETIEALPKRQHKSYCRPDMEVNALPQMSDDSVQMLQDFFTYLTQPNGRTCGKILRFGGEDPRIYSGRPVPLVDGQKYACADPEFSLLSTENCIVYSFGINDDWSFDDEMENLGCQIFAFDPSMNQTTGGQNGTIFFARYGIGYWDGVSENDWQIRTLDSFIHQLHHSERSIQYIKMDVETAEWQVLSQQTGKMRNSSLFKNVEQLGVELHFPSPWLDMLTQEKFYRDAYDIFLRMQQLGFYLFSYQPNQLVQPDLAVPGWKNNITSAFEVVWLKTNCADV